MIRRTKCPFHGTNLCKTRFGLCPDENSDTTWIEHWKCDECIRSICLRPPGVKFAYEGISHYSDEISEITDLTPTIHAIELIKNVSTEDVVEVVYDTFRTTVFHFRIKNEGGQRLLDKSYTPETQELNLLDIDNLVYNARQWRLPVFH